MQNKMSHPLETSLILRAHFLPESMDTWSRWWTGKTQAHIPPWNSKHRYRVTKTSLSELWKPVQKSTAKKPLPNQQRASFKGAHSLALPFPWWSTCHQETARASMETVVNTWAAGWLRDLTQSCDRALRPSQDLKWRRLQGRRAVCRNCWNHSFTDISG